MEPRLKAPFPWFGGKSRAAHLIWPRVGNVPNLVIPFCGSLSELLLRPEVGNCETVNDIDCYLANFWRAVADDPEAVAYWADYPINEADLHARHQWLVDQKDFRERIRKDPHYYDAKIAGWWVWGICQWIGGGWCVRPEWRRSNSGRASKGIHASRVIGDKLWQKRPNLHRSSRGVHRKTPTMKRALGSGIHRTEIHEVKSRLPHIATNGSGARGTLGEGLSQQKPQLSGDGSGSGRGVFSQAISENLVEYMYALQDRLRRVRVCCGDWKRIVGRSATTCIGLTGVILDPPYSADRDRVYAEDCMQVAIEVREWALVHGDDPKMRIALCGYEGEHDRPAIIERDGKKVEIPAIPSNWECIEWKANGGYGNQSAKGRGRDNAELERIWFSPNCLKPEREPFLDLSYDPSEIS